MGKAVGYFKVTSDYLDKAKQVASLVPSNYYENFKKRNEEIT